MGQKCTCEYLGAEWDSVRIRSQMSQGEILRVWRQRYAIAIKCTQKRPLAAGLDNPYMSDDAFRVLLNDLDRSTAGRKAGPASLGNFPEQQTARAKGTA